MNVDVSLHKKRMLFFVTSLELGGAERQAIWLARYLMKRFEMTIEIWGFLEPGDAMRLCREYGVPVRHYPLPWSDYPVQRQAALVDLLDEVRQFRPDAIFSFTTFANVICALFWKWSGARTFIWNQGDGGFDRTDPYLEKKAIPLTPRYISNSRHAKDFLVNEFRIAPETCEVIYNGIQLEPAFHTAAQWRQQLEITDQTFLVGMLANLRAIKGHSRLLEAWKEVSQTLQAQGRPALLTLAGRRDDAYESLIEQAKQLGISDSVRFLGLVKDVSGWLSALDLSVLTSRSEGCPNAVLESLAAGVPFVGVDIPGIREAVGPDYFEWLSTPDDNAALARNLLRAAAGEGPSAELVTASRRRVEREFSLENLGEITARVLRDALAESDSDWAGATHIPASELALSPYQSSWA